MLNLIYMLGDSDDKGVQCNLCPDGDGKWSNTAKVLIFWQPFSKDCAQHVKALAWMPCCTGSYQMFWYNSDLEYLFGIICSVHVGCDMVCLLKIILQYEVVL